MLSGNALADPAFVTALIDTAHRTERTDPGWDLLSFAALVRGIRPADLRIATVPIANPNLNTPQTGAAIGLESAEVRTFVANLPASTTSTPDSCVN